MLLCCADSTAPTVEQCEAADLLQAWFHPCKQRESASLSEFGESVVKCKSFCLGRDASPGSGSTKAQVPWRICQSKKTCAESGGMHYMESSSIKNAL